MKLPEGQPLTEKNLAEYPPYQAFIDRVGGPSIKIPSRHNIPLIVRMRQEEVAYVTGVLVTPNEEIAPLIATMDSYYGYREDAEGKYLGNESSAGALAAQDFFTQNALEPEKIEGLKEIYQTQLEKARKNSDLQERLRELNQKREENLTIEAFIAGELFNHHIRLAAYEFAYRGSQPSDRFGTTG